MSAINPDKLVHRWLWLALPEDCVQEAALIDLEYPNLAPAARTRLLSYRLRKLRHEVWDRYVTPAPAIRKAGVWPSKLKKASGYRQDSSRKADARQKISPERRREIAMMGQEARRRRKAA